MDTPNETNRLDEPQAVRALAHPLRLELLDVLRFEGPSTATQLAQRLGQSSGATSYHLRQLAHYGYIEEAALPGGNRRGKRERWWQYRERMVRVPGGSTGGLGGRRLLAELLSREVYALDRFLAARSRRVEWDEAAFLLTRAYRLTATELTEFRRGIEGLLDQLRPADAEHAPADALPVRFLAFGFPQTWEKEET
jgi:DNA-binding transcriptional ArsR family regulator